MMNILIGFLLGAGLVMLIVAAMLHPGNHLGECRAANPGFDCDLGWVKSEPFK